MINVYSKEGCIFCERTINLLKKRNIPFQEFKLDVNFDIGYIKALYPRMTTFPIIVNGIHLIGGYSDLVEKLMTDKQFGKTIINE